jgi:cardiolipin synthase
MLKRITVVLSYLFFFLMSVNAEDKVACGVMADTVSQDTVVADYLRTTGVPFSSNNKVVLLKSGLEKFEDLFTAVRQAKHYIHLEYFNFRNDSIAFALFDLLAERAAAGVEVRALFDGWGNDSNNKPLKKKHLVNLRNRGIQIYEYDPVRFPWVNHVTGRDHRKIVVIDGVIAYTGGMNVADYYITGKPEFGEWRDMHMRVEGDAVGDLHKIFLRMWRKVTHETLDSLKYSHGYYTDTNFNGLRPDTTSTAGSKCIGVVDRTPHVTPKAARQAYIASLDHAQEVVKVINPYFCLTPSVRSAFRRMLKRGVRLELMISAKADVPITPHAVHKQAYKLLKRGAHVYVYHGGFHHSKVMMVDSLFCTVGSINLDSRSLATDNEVNCFIFDRETTAELTDMFEKDKRESCTELTREMWKQLPWRKRAWKWICNLFTPLL